MIFKRTPLTMALSLALAACGGGGGSQETLTGETFTLPGTAANGAPYPVDSLVTVTAASGQTFTGKVTDQLGNYEVTVNKAASPPFVVSVSAEDLPTLVSVSTEAQPARINVTPITNLIAATLSPSGNPDKLAEEIKTSVATVTTQTLTAQKTAVMENILKPVTTALGDSTDPISGNFEIGKGHDLVLEALKIQVRPTGGTTSTVSVTLKSSEPLEMAPIALGAGGVASLPKLADTPDYTAPAKADLAGDGLPTQLASLLGRMTDCYALPVSTRVKDKGSVATDILADACKSIFLDNDPSKYKHNSYAVASTGAFKGIFSSSAVAQSVKFSLPSFEYKVKNGNKTDATKPMDGDVVFTARWQDSEGNSGIDEHWARPDANGKLFLTGNLSPLDIEVSPRAELREFPNRSGKDFYSTGYNLFVNAKHSYAKVIVTPPKGSPITLLKASGLDFFTISKNGTPSTTSVLRLAGSYKDSAQTGTPRADFPNLIWAGTEDTTDAAIAAFGAQGTWTFDLYTGATDSTPDASTKRRTLQRAPTLAELKAAAWPSLTELARKEVQADSGANGSYTFTKADRIFLNAGNAGDQPFWQVPAGAWSPTRATAFGTGPDGRTAFNDAVNFRSSARKAAISCSQQSQNDRHCSSDGNFAEGTRVGQITWSGRDSRRVSMGYAVDFRIQ